MAYRLSFELEGQPRHANLRGPRFGVGRDPDNDLYLPHPTVSRRHAVFRETARGWTVEDGHSTNRTQVNGLFLEPGPEGAHSVDDGDAIVFGDVRLELHRVEGSVSAEFEADPELLTSVTDVDILRKVLDSPVEATAIPRGDSGLLEILDGLGSRVVAIKALGEILEAVVDLAFQATSARRAAVLLWDEASRSLEPKVFRSRDTRAPDEPLTLSRSIVQRSFEERSVVQTDRRVSTSASMLQLGIGSAVAVPMWSEEGTLGVIYVDASPVQPPFERRAVALLTLVANYAAMAISQNRLLARIQREERRRQRLEGYFSSAVVQQILDSPGGDDFASAQDYDVTVLFCDMVGFTAYSEACSPHQVLNLLNRYFGQMTEAIFQHEGTLDKFIGDCIMCVFGAPLHQPDHARRAARAALDLRAAVAGLSGTGAADRALDFRIGLSSGRVVAGNLGHARRREWTVLGSTVNLASRMESSVAAPGQIVLTEFTRAGLGDEFEVRRLPDQTPKGFTRAIEVFELLGRRG